MKRPSKTTLLKLARKVYHHLPLSQSTKWRLRVLLQPILSSLISTQVKDISPKSILSVLSSNNRYAIVGRDNELEQVLALILQEMAAHAVKHGAPRLWIALPFLATGGAEWAAIHLCRATLELRPGQSVVLIVTDKDLINDHMSLPPEVFLVVMDRYFSAQLTFERKQILLRNLLRSGKPKTFHNINSEVAWHLIMSDGKHLKRHTRLYASIFAFQFAQDHRTKIGYAAYFLKKAMPHLAGLLSDNHRFLADATQEYSLSVAERERLAVLYQPCRLLLDDRTGYPVVSLKCEQSKFLSVSDSQLERRPQVLWAGRLDAEKRVDLLLEIVRCCQFADFRVFGQGVLNDHLTLPELPNLTYEGPFASPLEWLDRYNYDAFVFTSHWEGMPNILLEVGALGIPVIAPTVGGVIELINETTGYPLPEQPDVVHYKQALLQIINDPVQSLQRACKLQNLIEQRHGWQDFLKSVASLPDYLPPPVRIDSFVAKTEDASMPLVTVIIPCFNQGMYLEQSVMSALSACTSPMEILVVDDGSTDPSIAQQLAQAKELAPDVVRIHSQSRQGLSGARNTGMSLAKGKYLQFLDADDLLTPGKIDTQIAQFKIDPELDVSVCNYILCDESRSMFIKSEEAIAHFEMDEQDFLYHWERGFVIPIHAGLFRRSSLMPELEFDIHVRAKEDWLFWTRLSLAGIRFGYVEGHWVIYRQHAMSMRCSYVNMGAAWLQAGLKINEIVGYREPLFFESVVSWFEECYRSNPSYKIEIKNLMATSSELTNISGVLASAEDPILEVRQEACIILEMLSSLVPLRHRPTISVVIPIYGHFSYLRSCICSLADQGEVDFEIICIDDGSEDPRISLLLGELQGKHPRLIVHREPCNLGISKIQNLAVKMASGDFIAFLDCDDTLVPRALEIVCAALNNLTRIDYLFTDRIDVDENDQVIRIARYGGYDRLKFKSQDLIAGDLLDGMVASHLKVIRRSVYQNVGGCNTKFSGVQDWDLALRIMHQGYKFFYLDQPLYKYKIHSESVTTKNNVSQMRKSNLVLRNYLEGWSENKSNSFKYHLISQKDFPVDLQKLKNVWKSGGRCAVDIRGEFCLQTTSFIREFNAYFDRIIWSDPRVPAALFGYLVNPQLQLIQSRECELSLDDICVQEKFF